MHEVIGARRRSRLVARDPARLGAEHHRRLRAARRAARRHRRAAAGGAGRRARHRRVGQGGALRPDLRCLQRPADDLRRRARVPARRRPGARRNHPPRREAAVRLLRGDGAEAHRHHPQGVRRRVRRHEQQAHPRRPESRVAVGGDRGHGRRRRGRDHLQGRDRRRARIRRRSALASSRVRGAIRQPVHRRGPRLRRRRHPAVRDAAAAHRRPGGARRPSATPTRERSMGTSRSEAGGTRLCAKTGRRRWERARTRPAVPSRPRRQPGRDRGPDHPRLPGAGDRVGGRLQRRRCRGPSTSASPTAPSGSARRRRPRATCGSTPSSRRGGDGRRRHPPRLRLPCRARRLRPRGSRRRA